MTRQEVKDTFRSENPDITDRVIDDPVLNTWCVQGNLDMAIRARLIRGEFTYVTSGTEEFFRDLTAENDKFYDIDESPGGGIEYDGRRIVKDTMAGISTRRRRWRERTSGRVTRYFRRGQFLWYERPAEDGKTIRVYAVLLPDEWDDDNKIPFNELTYLEPFHPGLVKYLEWKSKGKIEKGQAEVDARNQYRDYANWALEQVGGDILGAIFLENKEKRAGGRRR